MEQLLSGDHKDRVEAIIIAKRMGQRATPIMPYLIDNVDNPMKASVGELAFHALDDFGEAALDPLIAALRIDQYRGEKRKLILGLLGSIEDRRAVPALISVLEDKDPEVRAKTVAALSRIPDKRAFEPLLRCLHDPNDRVVSYAISALGQIGDQRAVDPIIPFLTRRREWDQAGVRRHAVEALGKLGDRRAFEPLLAAYQGEEDPRNKSPDLGVRESALEALGRTKDPRAFEVLCRALNKNQEVSDRERVAAVWGLAALGDARSINLLKPILKHERPPVPWFKKDPGHEYAPTVRPAAACALVSTGDDEAIQYVYEEYRASPETVAAEIYRGVLGSLKDLHFRTAAVDALAMSPKPKAYLKVINILSGTDALMCREAAAVLYRSTISQQLSEMDISLYQKRRLPALSDMRVLVALMKVAESVPESKQTDRKMLKLYRETREYAVKALKKSGNAEALRFVEKLQEESR